MTNVKITDFKESVLPPSLLKTMNSSGIIALVAPCTTIPCVGEFRSEVGAKLFRQIVLSQ